MWLLAHQHIPGSFEFCADLEFGENLWEIHKKYQKWRLVAFPSSRLTRLHGFSVQSRSEDSERSLILGAGQSDEGAACGALCWCCWLAHEARRPSSPAGGSQALVTTEAANFEVSFIRRTARVSTRSLNRFCFLKAWVIYPGVERWCSVCWEKPWHVNALCRIMCLFFFFFFLYAFSIGWDFRLLR